MDLLLVLLYAPTKVEGPGSPIEGITRLQKLAYLLKMGHGPKAVLQQAQQWSYRPYKMGPFSDDVRRCVEELRNAGLVRTEKLKYLIRDDADPEIGDEPRSVTSLRFGLTAFGMRVGSDLFASLSKKDQDDLREFKSYFNALTLRELLIFVYEKYPESTVNSEIRNKLGF